METFERSGRIFRAEQIGRGGPSVFWGTGAHETPEALIERLEGQNLLLVAYQAEDWNRCFSPWPAPPAFGSEGFAGEGVRTLRWLTDECVPQIAARFGAREKLLCGYSLAGLFSLWAFYETGAFAGAASCSGSLWFPGWQDYMRGKAAPPGSRVYLSLGEREERTKNRAMRSVGDATRAQYAAMQNDGNLQRFALQWEPGGHFNEPEARLARGILWLLSQSSSASSSKT